MVMVISRSEREVTFTLKAIRPDVDQFWLHLKILIINKVMFIFVKIVLLPQFPW